MFEIKTGLADEKATHITKDQMTYAGTDTRDAYHTGWEVSNQTVHHRDAARTLQATRGPIMAKTMHTAERILVGSEKQYTNPESLSGAISEGMRTHKDNTKEERERLTKEVAHELPRASQQVIDATVLRRMYEADLRANDLSDPELTLKPDCKKTLKSVKVKVWHHNGKYEKNKFESNKMAWSCCMAKAEDTQGCCCTIVDKQRWELSSFNS